VRHEFPRSCIAGVEGFRRVTVRVEAYTRVVSPYGCLVFLRTIWRFRNRCTFTTIASNGEHLPPWSFPRVSSSRRDGNWASS